MDLLKPPELALRILSVKAGTRGLRPIDIEVMLAFIRKRTRDGSIILRQRGRTAVRSLSLQTGHAYSSIHESLSRLRAAGLLTECPPKLGFGRKSKITPRRMQLKLRRLHPYENGRMYSALYKASTSYAWTFLGHDIANRKALGFLGLQILDIIASKGRCPAAVIATLLGASDSSVFRALRKLGSVGLVTKESDQYILAGTCIDPESLARSLGVHGESARLAAKISRERRLFRDAREFRHHMLLMGEPPVLRPEDKHKPGDTYSPCAINRFTVTQENSRITLEFRLDEKDSVRMLPASGRVELLLLWDGEILYDDFWHIESTDYEDHCTEWHFDYCYRRSLEIPKAAGYCTTRSLSRRDYDIVLEWDPWIRDTRECFWANGVPFEAHLEFRCATTNQLLKAEIGPRLVLPSELLDAYAQYCERVEHLYILRTAP